MAYVKNTWQTGDTITADLMNHMEDGISANAEAAASQSGAIEQVQTTLATKENAANKVTEITDESTDEQYPSAKAVHDAIEEAGGGGTNFLAIELTYNESTGNYDLNKTWQEIYDAFSTGKPCIITDNSNNGAKIQVLVVYQGGIVNYYVEFVDREQTIRSCSTDNPNGYPNYSFS